MTMKMKKSIILLVSAVVSAFAVTGCKDFLTKDPLLSQSTDITLSSYTGLNNATFGAYYYLASSGWYGQSWIIDAEMRSGNGKKTAFRNSNRCVQPYIWNYTEDATSGMWSYCYVTVAQCNNVIDNLEGKAGGDVTEQDLNNLKAECLFLRAFSHFCNVLTYGQPYTYCKKSAPESLGVPYVYHTDPNGKPFRETVISNYENIVKDLLEAESIIDPDYVRKGTTDELATVNISTIQALLSRVYLYMGEWQKAADYATKVIDSKKYKMWTAEEYPKVWGAEKGSGEIIFEVYGNITNSAWASWEDMSYLTSPEGSGDPAAAKPLLDLYADDDVRLATYRTDEKEESNGILWTTKYPGKGLNTPDANNVVVLRLSEMYLNRAEALMNGAQIEGVTAWDDLNAITSKRNADAYTSAGNLDIQRERRKELAWEGHYIYDLARWGKAVERTAADYPLCTQNLNVPFPSNKWALPLPKSEREVNPNLEQNPL